MESGVPFRMPVMDPCYFCEIINGTMDQWNVIDRTASTITLLNARQFEIGQCMVVPNRHTPTLLDLCEEEGSAVMVAAKKAARAFVKAFAPDGVLLYQNTCIRTTVSEVARRFRTSTCMWCHDSPAATGASVHRTSLGWNTMKVALRISIIVL